MMGQRPQFAQSCLHQCKGSHVGRGENQVTGKRLRASAVEDPQGTAWGHSCDAVSSTHHSPHTFQKSNRWHSWLEEPLNYSNDQVSRSKVVEKFRWKNHSFIHSSSSHWKHMLSEHLLHSRKMEADRSLSHDPPHSGLFVLRCITTYWIVPGTRKVNRK